MSQKRFRIFFRFLMLQLVGTLFAETKCACLLQMSATNSCCQVVIQTSFCEILFLRWRDMSHHWLAMQQFEYLSPGYWLCSSSELLFFRFFLFHAVV